jgi:hypothetical protein
MQSLASLKPSFVQMGQMGGFDAVAVDAHPDVEAVHHVHHAGNSSGIVDGAAAVLIGRRPHVLVTVEQGDAVDVPHRHDGVPEQALAPGLGRALLRLDGVSMSRVGLGASGGAWPVDPAIAVKSYFMPQGRGRRGSSIRRRRRR